MPTYKYFNSAVAMINHHQLRLVGFTITMDLIRGYFNILENTPDMVIADAAKQLGIDSYQLIALNGWIKHQCEENEVIKDYGYSVQRFAANLVREDTPDVR